MHGGSSVIHKERDEGRAGGVSRANRPQRERGRVFNPSAGRSSKRTAYSGLSLKTDPFTLQGKYSSWHSTASTSQDPSVMGKGLKIKQNKVKMHEDKENRVEGNSKQ